jgi:uncharacterized protein YbcC (UPF0753/DUF2309 family)
VEARSVDLAQVRPELGHATNAVCIIGRRWRTRGLFLDRRAFLVSYDPGTDDDGTILARTLAAVGPVGAGINLEYFFSVVDRLGYGAGTKLPHNITGLIGVMDGHASDLRTGLPWQMVEIHEPVRLLVVIDQTPEKIMAAAEAVPSVEEHYDAITCVYLFHELPEVVRTRVVQEWFRVLKPGGKVFFIDMHHKYVRRHGLASSIERTLRIDFTNELAPNVNGAN